MPLSKYIVDPRHGLLLGLLLLASFLTRFIYFGWPDSSIIDEINFGKYLSSYFTHQYYLDVHPPLGKLIIAAFASFFDFEPILYGTDWRQEYTDNNYLILRFMPMLFGIVLPLIIYLLTFQWWKERKLAFFVALLVVFENASITQSRLLFWDSFLLCFGFASVLFYSYYRENRRWRDLILCGVFAGAAFSIKWTAATFIALPMAIDTAEFLWQRLKWQSVATTAAVVLSTAMMVYVAVFYIHFSLLPLSGTGNAFMSEEFRMGLEGNRYTEDQKADPQLAFYQKFIELNRRMYLTNQRMADHPYGSEWYQWPLGEKAVGYWRRGDRDITMQPNLVVWWAGSLSMLLLVFAFVLRPANWRDPWLWAMVAGFTMNWLPFALIERVMFLHSYFVAMIFSLLAVGWLVRSLPWLRKNYGWFLVPVVFGYIWMSHLTYGLPPAFMIFQS